MGTHIALLGDSSFDNASYTGKEPDVASHLRALVGPAVAVTLLAVDGSTTQSLAPQLDRIAATVTHAVLSVGGNDALLVAQLLDTPVRSTADALDLFGAAVDEFADNHAHALAALAARAPTAKLVVCTIYEGNLGLPEGPRARIALKLWNDVIARNARRVGATLIDLRDVVSVPADFANPIEPSGEGGRKIAVAIARACA